MSLTVCNSCRSSIWWSCSVFLSFFCPSSTYNTSHLGAHFFYLLKLFQSFVFQGMFVTASPSSVPSLFTYSSVLVRIPVCISCLTNFSPLLFFFIPSKPEGVEKETTQNSVLCVKGKAHCSHTLYLFLCGLMGGMLEACLYHIPCSLTFLGNQNMPHQLGV